MRTALVRLPGFLFPEPAHYGHVVAFDATGRVLASLQDPDDGYRQTTSALETRDFLWLGSLEMPVVGRLGRAHLGPPVRAVTRTGPHRVGRPAGDHYHSRANEVIQ